jgi:hypothetical protein
LSGQLQGIYLAIRVRGFSQAATNVFVLKVRVGAVGAFFLGKWEIYRFS